MFVVQTKWYFQWHTIFVWCDNFLQDWILECRWKITFFPKCEYNNVWDIYGNFLVASNYYLIQCFSVAISQTMTRQYIAQRDGSCALRVMNEGLLRRVHILIWFKRYATGAKTIQKDPIYSKTYIHISKIYHIRLRLKTWLCVFHVM